MADSLINQYDLAADIGFVKRVQMAIVTAAKQISAEDPDVLLPPPGVKDQDPKQVLHIARAKLAYKVLYQPDYYARLFAHAIAVNPVITDKSADGDINFEVSASWNAFSLGAPT